MATRQHKSQDPYIEEYAREANRLNGHDKKPQDVVDKIYGLKGSHLLALIIFLISGTAASTVFGLKAVLTLDRLEVAMAKQNCFNRYFLEAVQSREPYHGQCE